MTTDTPGTGRDEGGAQARAARTELPGQGGTPPRTPGEYRDPGDPDMPAQEAPVAAPQREPVTGPRETAADPVAELYRLERQQPLPERLPGAQGGSMDAPRAERVIEEQDGPPGDGEGSNPRATRRDTGIDR